MTDYTPPPLPSPAPAGYPYGPVWRDQRTVDAGHLRLLWIFHYAYAALGLLTIGFLVLHYTIMSTAFSNPKMWQQAGQNAPPFDPAVFFGMFKWFYVLMGGWTLVGMVLNLLSAWCIQRRKSRTFSMVVAGLNCIRLPLGTILGVFTLIVLGRESVAQAYGQPPTATPPAPAA